MNKFSHFFRVYFFTFANCNFNMNTTNNHTNNINSNNQVTINIHRDTRSQLTNNPQRRPTNNL